MAVVPPQQPVGVARPADHRVAFVFRPAQAVGGEGDGYPVPFVRGAARIAGFVEEGLVAALRVVEAVVAADVAPGRVEHEEVVLLRAAVLDQSEVGALPEDAVLRDRVAVAVEEVGRVEAEVRPLSQGRSHSGDPHAPERGVPHAEAVGAAQHRAVELEAPLPGIDGEHQRVAGVADRLVEGALEAAHLRDDQLVAEELFFGADVRSVPVQSWNPVRPEAVECRGGHGLIIGRIRTFERTGAR